MRRFNYDKVIDVVPDTRTVFYSNSGFEINGLLFEVIELDNKDFQEFLYFYKKHIKNRYYPSDRVEIFEYVTNRGIDFPKFVRLYNSRLRPGEEDMKL